MFDYKIGIIGDYDSICGFSAVGIETFEVNDPSEGAEKLNKLANSGYGIIFITENLCREISDTLDKYRTLPLPAVIPVPPVSGTNGFGLSYVKKAVEQAVGSDIIFND